MRFLYVIFSTLFLGALSGCPSSPQIGPPIAPPIAPPVAVAPDGVAEVSLNGSTGHLGSSFTIALRRDGTARCECVFFDLDETGEPRFGYPESLCGRLYNSDRDAFALTGARERQASFVGTIAAEQFERQAALIVENGFFSMEDKYLERGLSEPPETTRAVFAGGIKEVSDNGQKGGERLSAIKRSIYDLGLRIGWKSAKK